jgi:hypothetical protein
MANGQTQAPHRRSLQGIYELGHALHVLDLDLHGFGRGDVEAVECFWTYSEMDQSLAGFVLRLRDRRRAYLDFHHWHGFEQEEDFRIEVTFLQDGQRHPAFAPSDEPPGGWSSETAHLQKMLSRLAG